MIFYIIIAILTTTVIDLYYRWWSQKRDFDRYTALALLIIREQEDQIEQQRRWMDDMARRQREIHGCPPIDVYLN